MQVVDSAARKFHGQKDEEILVRQRYLDLIYTDGVLERMLKRSTLSILSARRCEPTGFMKLRHPSCTLWRWSGRAAVCDSSQRDGYGAVSPHRA